MRSSLSFAAELKLGAKEREQIDFLVAAVRSYRAYTGRELRIEGFEVTEPPGGAPEPPQQLVQLTRAQLNRPTLYRKIVTRARATRSHRRWAPLRWLVHLSLVDRRRPARQVRRALLALDRKTLLLSLLPSSIDRDRRRATRYIVRRAALRPREHRWRSHLCAMLTIHLAMCRCVSSARSTLLHRLEISAH